MPKRVLTAAAVLSVASLGLIACGSSKTTTTSTSAQLASADTQQAPSSQQTSVVAGRHVTVTMGDFFFKPQNVTVPAGKVVITTPNTGSAEHELVLLRTNTDPAKLKSEKDGEAEEDAYSSPGEIADVEAGTTKHATFHLKPGNYVMICNVPGHYKAGMYGRLIVK
jgi:uncharacterized cupredoxin-like copper-binding protein